MLFRVLKTERFTIITSLKRGTVNYPGNYQINIYLFLSPDHLLLMTTVKLPLYSSQTFSVHINTYEEQGTNMHTGGRLLTRIKLATELVSA